MAKKCGGCFKGLSPLVADGGTNIGWVCTTCKRVYFDYEGRKHLRAHYGRDSEEEK